MVSKIEPSDVLDIVRQSDPYKSESSFFGDRHLHDKDKRAIMGSEWLGSLVSFSKGNSMNASSGKPNAFSCSSNNSPKQIDRFSLISNLVHSNKKQKGDSQSISGTFNSQRPPMMEEYKVEKYEDRNQAQSYNSFTTINEEDR